MVFDVGSGVEAGLSPETCEASRSARAVNFFPQKIPSDLQVISLERDVVILLV
jgi:hypothetical protein